MAQDQYRSFGQSAKAVSKYYGAAFADQAIGNVMTEAKFPTVLHQDPRYFTNGKGGFLKRTGYAISREFITRKDDGRSHFNTSELLGNAVAAGISNLYYPAADRSLGKTANTWGQQISLDSAFNIMKCPSVGTLPKRGQAFYCTSNVLSPQSGKFGKYSLIPRVYRDFALAQRVPSI
jgi:hypothetical protein